MLSLSTKGRGTRFAHKLYTLLWWLLSILPLIAYICWLSCYDFSSHDPADFATFFTDWFGIVVSESNVVFTTLRSILSGDILPFLTAEGGMLFFIAWLVELEIIHVLFDVLVFIPRFAHKLTGKAIDYD